jgi:hypothetical protein
VTIEIMLDHHRLNQWPNLFQSLEILVVAQQCATKLWWQKIDFLSVFCEKFGFQWKELGKFKNFLGFECKFNQISYILAKFCKRINTKKMKKNEKAYICIKQNWFTWIPIDWIWLFDVYDLLSLHFVSWYGHKDLPTCQNIGKK